MTDTDEFTIHRPIEGEITATSKPQLEQWDAATFLRVVDEILAIKGVKAIRWTQYTPYFNDGEPCEFDVSELEVKLSKKWRNEDDDDDDHFQDSWTLKYYADREGRKLPEGLLDALNKWESAHFEAVARKNFGDHAQITTSGDGFEVEFYDHD